MQTYQETRGRVVFVEGSERSKPSILPESRYADPDWIKEQEPATIEVELQQSHTYYQVSAESAFADFEELVPSADERVDLINTALALKQQQFVRKQLLNKDFVPVEGTIDLKDVVGAVTERKTASPEQKAANALGKLLGRSISMDELNVLIEAMKPTASASA
jgi:hypothetical protein